MVLRFPGQQVTAESGYLPCLQHSHFPCCCLESLSLCLFLKSLIHWPWVCRNFPHPRAEITSHSLFSPGLSLDHRPASVCLLVLHISLISSIKLSVSGSQVILSHSHNAFHYRTSINVRLNQPSLYLKMSTVWLTHFLLASEWRYPSIHLFFQYYQWDFTLSSYFMQSFIYFSWRINNAWWDSQVRPPPVPSDEDATCISTFEIMEELDHSTSFGWVTSDWWYKPSGPLPQGLWENYWG